MKLEAELRTHYMRKHFESQKTKIVYDKGLSLFLTRFNPGYDETTLYCVEKTDIPPGSANIVAVYVHVFGGAGHDSQELVDILSRIVVGFENEGMLVDHEAYVVLQWGFHIRCIARYDSYTDCFTGLDDLPNLALEEEEYGGCCWSRRVMS